MDEIRGQLLSSLTVWVNVVFFLKIPPMPEGAKVVDEFMACSSTEIHQPAVQTKEAAKTLSALTWKWDGARQDAGFAQAL